MTGPEAPRIAFDTAFLALTGHPPLKWQRRLFEQLVSGTVPRICDLPTGLGKTSVIPIWVIALARQTQNGQVTLPRRLAYVVNRRTVVDQATSVVELIRRRLLIPDGPNWFDHKEALCALAESLKSLTANGTVFMAVSTLRGELADNAEWKADPARPAIIIGTVDMIGSKLLFSGYGDGPYWRAQHAGLVGQDSLIVHDEAHLTPAFSDLLRQVAESQRNSREPRPLQIMELSATSRGNAGPALTLEPEDEEDRVVTDRLDAAKHMRLHDVKADSGDKPAHVVEKVLARIVALSLEHREAHAKVLLYLRSPEHAQAVFTSLGKQLGKDAEGRTALLTGTVRGFERDRLVHENPVYQAFLDTEHSADRSLYLVSTSAGEVGIDIDADHIVCDMTSLDSMIQRLGRVNRRGGPARDARVDVVLQFGEVDERDSQIKGAIEATKVILSEWAKESDGQIDVSPRGLRKRLGELDAERREQAFSPTPVVAPVTDILLDAWSLTSISGSMPGRPEVAPYLHGLEKDLPETYIAWRKEVELLSRAGVSEETLADWFQACPVETQERLRDRTYRVKKALEDLLHKHRRSAEDEGLDFRVVLLNERGEAKWQRLSAIVEKEFPLAYRTVVLPVQAGGLSGEGVLIPTVLHPVPDLDVAERSFGAAGQRRRERWLVTSREGGEVRCRRLINGETANRLPRDLNRRELVALEEPLEGDEDGESCHLLLMAALEDSEAVRIEQTLTSHGSLISQSMGLIADRIGLDRNPREAVILAAQFHDRGKDRPVWQRYARSAGSEPLAKSLELSPPPGPWWLSPRVRVVAGCRERRGNREASRGRLDPASYCGAPRLGKASFRGPGPGQYRYFGRK